MSNEEAIANLVGLMTSFHLEIRTLTDDLKCTECKSVLRNACQMPCGCRFCRACIDDVISRGDQFCPGDSQECGATPLSTTLPDYRANRSVLKLTAKCPHDGCSRECPLADMEGHMRACSRKNIDCPFRELGCTQGALPGEEMSGHLLQESRSHSEILIGTVANISRDMEMLKRELLLKDEQMANEMKLITDENKLIKDEIKSFKDENESIKREKEVLWDRMRQMSEKLELEFDERRQSYERDIAMATVVTGAVASNRDEMEPVRGDIRSIRDQFDRMKCQMESIQMAVGLEQLDDWLIDADVAKTDWGGVNARKTSGKFGLARVFEVLSYNHGVGGALWFALRIWAGPDDHLLQWPFRCEVTVTVANRDRREACSRQTRQCLIKRPADNQYSGSDVFTFQHAALRGDGVQLDRGVLISCRIVPSAG